MAAPKAVRIIESDDTDVYSEEEISAEEEKKKRKRPVKKPVDKTPKQPRRKRKNQNEAEVVKKLLCEWSQDEDCMKRILDGKKLAFIPVFL